MTNPTGKNQALKSRHIGAVNMIGLYTLSKREIARFLNVYTQTIVAPVIMTLLFFTVFALAFGGAERQVGEIPFLQFLAPGLIMMGIAQNAFANTSSSLVISKIQGNIVDILMPPLSAAELLAGFLIGAVCRGVAVGLATGIVMSLFTALSFHSLGIVVVFGILGALMLGVLGVIAGVWSDRFDHMAAFTNFIITPLTFLSGTFYSLESLPEMWQGIARFNPFFYMIDGFRSGFIGMADGSAMTGILVLCGVNMALIFMAYRMLKVGYKIKS